MMEAAQSLSGTLSSGSAASSAPVLPSSPDISIEFHGDGGKDGVPGRPAPLTGNLSAPAVQPAYQSPIRQHKRTPSQHREVKETLNARSEYTSDDSDGRSHHCINQYTILEEIGRGSYGAVHRATDQFGQEYAVKEFSKARLRKRAQSNILKGPRHIPRRGGLHALVGSRLNDHRSAEAKDALHLIREEIAIMKKLNHPNLVQLIEVLDDPEEDSLYMVLEMCKKGVIMKVGLDQTTEPYDEERCRHWFRDLILGIEYLHAQGVVHRDIKPDNLLLTEDDVLKVVDFGVSEMFEKLTEMRTAKSAGSPAFLPPELCVVRHGNVSGTAADIWSMGVSLYCLRYGRIPFDRSSPLEIYEAIKNEPLQLGPDEGTDFADLMHRVMEKDPDKRITVSELREHAWVTKGHTDPLLSTAENCAVMIEPPNELEVNHAFTRRMSHLLCVMKAISRFKSLLPSRSTPGTPIKSISRYAAFIGKPESAPPKDAPVEKPARPDMALVTDVSDPMSTTEQAAALIAERQAFLKKRKTLDEVTSKEGDASATDASLPFLGIGTGGRDEFASPSAEPPRDVVSDSPTAVDFNVYDRAYEAEVSRLRSQRENNTMYLNRFVDADEEDVLGGDGGNNYTTVGAAPAAKASSHGSGSGHKFADLVSLTINEVKERAQQ